MEPSLKKGLDYWNDQDATYNGVLGGYGNGSLPRIDSLGSRQFLMELIPELCIVGTCLKEPGSSSRSTYRALDVGCGVGRTTKDVLLHLVDEVVLVEPVGKFLEMAKADCETWKGIASLTKSVTFVQCPLQDYDLSDRHLDRKVIGRSGKDVELQLQSGFDIIWCQWCLGHLSDGDLVAFFRQARSTLKDRTKSLIVVKENICRDEEDGGARAVFDYQDSSITRSDAAWLELFRAAGLQLVAERVQKGFPQELYKVKMYALR